jgi:hypothetical protein
LTVVPFIHIISSKEAVFILFYAVGRHFRRWGGRRRYFFKKTLRRTMDVIYIEKEGMR